MEHVLSSHKREIIWDSNIKKEVEDAKKIYQQARKERREITLLNGNSVPSFKPEYEALWILPPKMTNSQVEARIYDETGDRRIVWDSLSQNEVNDAFNLFNDYLKKGWRAYAIGEDGKKVKRIHKFDSELQEVYFDEASSKEKLSTFVKSFKKVEVTPKTRAG